MASPILVGAIIILFILVRNLSQVTQLVRGAEPGLLCTCKQSVSIHPSESLLILCSEKLSFSSSPSFKALSIFLMKPRCFYSHFKDEEAETQQSLFVGSYRD